MANEHAVRWETATYPFIVRKYGGGTLVEGGHEHDGSPLFVARAFYWGGTHPGKTSSILKGADITFAGKEYVSLLASFTRVQLIGLPKVFERLSSARFDRSKLCAHSGLGA